MARGLGTVVIGFAFAVALVALCALAPPAAAQQRIGIVLLHGKLGLPLGTSFGARPPTGAGLIAALRNAGYLVATPEMCWSRQRGFDKTYPDCIAEVDTAIAKLKA